jgi:hypothetical protein
MRTTFRSESRKERENSEDVEVGARIVLKWILENRLRGCVLDSCRTG